MMTTKEVSEHKTPSRSRAQAEELSAPQADNALSRRIAAGPLMAAQRKVIDQIDPVQRQGPEEDEELLQGKFAAQLMPEEEEELPAQGSFDPSGPRTIARDVE